MRPWGRIFALPWVLLALLLQVGAPVEAARMAARMADPFAAMPICSPDKAKTGGSSDGQAPADRHGHECGLCAACAPLHATPLAATQPLLSLSVAEIRRPQFAVQTSPRGPPLKTAKARAPPPLLQSA